MGTQLSDVDRRYNRASAKHGNFFLCAPFVLHGYGVDEYFEKYERVYRYAEIVERLAKEYGLGFISFQRTFDEELKKEKTRTFIV